MNNKYSIWGLTVGGFIVVILTVMWLAIPNPSGITYTRTIDLPVTETDWTKGASTSPVTIIEYSDFQCPACAYYSPMANKAVLDFPSSVRLVYRQFPLAQHLDSKLAAYATEAAGRQGKFFEMYDLLFGKQKEWGVDTHILPTDPTELTPAMQAALEPKLLGYAQSLGLDIVRFKADMASKEIHDRIDQAVKDGEALKIDSTPTFFINGKQIVNPKDYQGFKDYINAAIKG